MFNSSLAEKKSVPDVSAFRKDFSDHSSKYLPQACPCKMCVLPVLPLAKCLLSFRDQYIFSKEFNCQKLIAFQVAAQIFQCCIILPLIHAFLKKKYIFVYKNIFINCLRNCLSYLKSCAQLNNKLICFSESRNSMFYFQNASFSTAVNRSSGTKLSGAHGDENSAFDFISSILGVFCYQSAIKNNFKRAEHLKRNVPKGVSICRVSQETFRDDNGILSKGTTLTQSQPSFTRQASTSPASRRDRACDTTAVVIGLLFVTMAYGLSGTVASAALTHSPPSGAVGISQVGFALSPARAPTTSCPPPGSDEGGKKNKFIFNI